MTLRNKLDDFPEISETLIPNEEDKNFVLAYIEAAAAECIHTKLRAKHRVPWEIVAVRKKWDNVKTGSLRNKRNPNNTQNNKKAQNELINACKKKKKKKKKELNTFKVRSIKF